MLPFSDVRTPIHASFSLTEDILAILWESGYVELWNLHTRREPSRQAVMAPTLMWNDNISIVQSGRQIAVTTESTPPLDGLSAQITILGSDHRGNDIMTVLEFGKDSSTKSHNIALPHRNGRLVMSDVTAFWQAPDGHIFEGEELPNH